MNSVIRLTDINYIDTVDFRFSVTAAFKFAWTDNRVERPADLKTGDMINLDLDFQKKLWMPDFYVNLFLQRLLKCFTLMCHCQVYDLSEFRHLELFGKEQAGLRIRKKENNDTGMAFYSRITFNHRMKYKIES